VNKEELHAIIQDAQRSNPAYEAEARAAEISLTQAINRLSRDSGTEKRLTALEKRLDTLIQRLAFAGFEGGQHGNTH